MTQLLPLPSPVPLFDDPLDNLIQANIVNITGLPASMVRPRFQPEPASHPEYNVDWCAFGIASYDNDAFAAHTFNPTGNGGTGSMTVERDELITVNLSFYGPDNYQYISAYREGIALDFNRFDLYAANTNLVSVGQIVNLPALLKDKWVKRLDTKVVFRRRVSRSYGVVPLIGNTVTLITDTGLTTTINTQQP